MLPESTAAITLQANDCRNTTDVTCLQSQDYFHHCWRLQTCETCLSSSDPCSWCATSQVCVPNDYLSYPFGILAPIKHEDICPLSWRERWEMRAKPFSCRCSTMTLMSVVIAVVATLVGVLSIYLTTLLSKWLRRKWKARQEGWWKVRSRPWRPRKGWFAGWIGPGSRLKAKVGEDEERRPLLDGTGSGS